MLGDGSLDFQLTGFYMMGTSAFNELSMLCSDLSLFIETVIFVTKLVTYL